MRISRGFYGVVDVLGDAVTDAPLALADLLVRGGAGIIQLRAKQASTRTLLALAKALRAQLSGVTFVVNDRLDVALAAGADAVHLGQDDLPLDAARAAVARAGGTLAIGVSTHTPEQAEAAAAAGADYLGFGPVFATATKANPDPVQGLTALAEAVRRAHPVPIVAIGGITVDQAAEVARAGATCACAISAVNHAADPAAAARAIADAFTA